MTLMDKPIEKVLIGMPVKDDLLYFRIAVDSLVNTTSYPFKLLIIDGGSTDGSSEYADLLPKFYPSADIEIIHKDCEGPIDAYNLLFEKCVEYDMDLYLTQTDVIHPKLFGRDWLGTMVQMSNFPSCGVVISLNGGGVSGGTYVENFRWAGGWSSLFKKEVIKKIGGYDKGFIIGDGTDIDHTYRLIKSGYLIYQAPFAVDHHMLNKRSLEGNYTDNELDTIKAKNARYFRKKHKLGEYK